MTVSPNTHCRVGRIKLKSGGAEVRVLERKPNPTIANRLLDKAAVIAAGFEEDGGLSGFALVAWSKDGHWNRATAYEKDSFMGDTLMPSFVADILRRDVMEDVAQDVIGGKT